jgi:hypothetical protein
MFQHDPDLVSIRGDARFQKLMGEPRRHDSTVIVCANSFN